MAELAITGRGVRGDTSEPLVDAGLIERADVELTARAANSATLVEVQRLVADLAASTGVGSAAIRRTDVEDTEDDALTLRLPIGPAAWCHELRVQFDDRATYEYLEHAAKELAAAAERGLSRPCRPVAAPALPVPPLYQAITVGARALIVSVDPASGWTPLSDAIEAVLGYHRHAPPPGRLIDLVHPEDRPAAIEVFALSCAGTHPPRAVDLRIRTASGLWRTLEVAARSFVDDPAVATVAFFAIDVTSQRETEHAVRVERGRLAKLVATTRDGLMLLDGGTGRIGVINEAARRLLDMAGGPGTAPHASGDWDSLLERLHSRLPNAAAVVPRLREAVLGGRSIVAEEISFEDGRVLELDFVPVDHDGESLGVLVHVRDVTARVAVRRGLEERSRGLEERNRALAEASALNNEFVATVAHELRGPLSSVVAFSHLLGDDTAGALTDDQRTYLDVIDRNVNRLLRLIEDLLLLSRLEARTLHLRPTPTRIPELLAGAVAERTPAASAAAITLDLDVTDGPEVVCDETRVHQVVDNLVNNAVKFTPSGGRVTVRARSSTLEWTIAVADTGVGIPAADLPRLFSAFFRGSNVASAVGRQVMPGTGLGLVVSRAIVELHGGTIQVASTEGVGTTVTLSLPLRPPVARGEVANPASPAQARNGG